MKALNNISRIQYRLETVMLLLNLYEYKGRIFYYDEMFKSDVNALLAKTLETDIIYLAKIMDLDLTDARLAFCAKKDFSPNNKQEQLLYNFKKIIGLVQNHHEHFELLPNEIKDLVTMLTKDLPNVTWRKVETNDNIFNKKYKDMHNELGQLIKLFEDNVRKKRYEYITIVTNFYVDYLNMELFDGMNEEIALILLYTLIFGHFPIFKYVSFFKYLEKYLKDFNHAKEQANYNWASQFSQTDHLNEIIYYIIKDSIKEVDDFSNEYKFEMKLNKSDNIENTILKFAKQFSKADIRKAHPTVSDSTIDRTLKRLKDEEKIMPIGTGRSAKWQLIIDNQKYIKFNLFEDDEK